MGFFIPVYYIVDLLDRVLFFSKSGFGLLRKTLSLNPLLLMKWATSEMVVDLAIVARVDRRLWQRSRTPQRRSHNPHRLIRRPSLPHSICWLLLPARTWDGQPRHPPRKMYIRASTLLFWYSGGQFDTLPTSAYIYGQGGWSLWSCVDRAHVDFLLTECANQSRSVRLTVRVASFYGLILLFCVIFLTALSDWNKPLSAYPGKILPGTKYSSN